MRIHVLHGVNVCSRECTLSTHEDSCSTHGVNVCSRECTLSTHEDSCSTWIKCGALGSAPLSLQCEQSVSHLKDQEIPRAPVVPTGMT